MKRAPVNNKSLLLFTHTLGTETEDTFENIFDDYVFR